MEKLLIAGGILNDNFCTAVHREHHWRFGALEVRYVDLGVPLEVGYRSNLIQVNQCRLLSHL
jgi:hypothetical protein